MKEDINDDIEKEKKMDSKENKTDFEEKKSNDDEIEEDLEIEVINEKNVNIEKTTKKNILPDILEAENGDILAFNFKYTGNNSYKWTVYHSPKEIMSLLKVLKIVITPNVYKSEKLFSSYTDLYNLGKVGENRFLTDDGIKLLNKFFTLLINEEELINRIKEVNQFFGIGGGSFLIYNNGNKPLEGWAYKKADPSCLRKVFKVLCFCIEKCVFKSHNKRWIVLKDDMIYYSNVSTTEVGKNTYFFDNNTKATEEGKDSLILTNNSRSLTLKFDDNFQRELWLKAINLRIEDYKKLVEHNIYKAYTNAKRNNLAHWFIDGEDYFSDLCEKLMDAKQSIFITDWWMSPEVFLTRPVDEKIYKKLAEEGKIAKETQPFSRLMDILNYKANKDKVKIYILLYYEVELVLTLNSKHTKEILESFSKNIIVTRHPQNSLDLLWSHHEKLVLIDQFIGYVGGLDLCWGRYDTRNHPIYEGPNVDNKYYFPFIDYSNARTADFINVDQYMVESVPRKTEVRMPWHDVHSRIIGPAVADMARHFVERWNFALFDVRNENKNITGIKQNKNVGRAKAYEKDKPFLERLMEKIMEEAEKESSISMSHDSFDVNDSSSEIKKKSIHKFAPKKNGFNEIKLDEQSNSELLAKNKLLNSSEEKQSKGEGEKLTNFEFDNNNNINTYNISKNSEDNQKLESELNPKKKIGEDEEKQLQENYMENKIKTDDPSLLKNKLAPQDEVKTTTYADLIQNIGETHKASSNWFKDLFKDNTDALERQYREKYFKENCIKSTIQVLRSCSTWSGGLEKTESSIMEAYCQLIQNSKHYIYIENQFFISKAFSEQERKNCNFKTNDVVENEIAYALRKRIERAKSSKENFKVFVFLPLLPGFAGNPAESNTLQIILKHTYATINRNNGLSIVEKLLERMPMEEIQNYIGFYSLRNHEIVNEIPRTELIYIHSKLMIVDDESVIIGSANINDRSMLGNRDSEFCVLIQENPKLKSIMNGKKKTVSKFAATFRRRLMAEHLGFGNEEKDIPPKYKAMLIDPVNKELFHEIKIRAKTNTEMYREIFKCYPDDCCKTFEQLKEYRPAETKEEIQILKDKYNQNSHKIKGHIVEFPTLFLEKENLGNSFFSKEKIVPEKNFT